MRNKALLYQWLKIFIIASIYGISFHQYLYLEELVPIFIIIFAAICLVLGFLTWMGVGLVILTLKNRSDAGLVKAAIAGQIVRDGKPRAVLGKIFPLDTPISAPFSGKKCAIVGYEIYQEYWTKTNTQGGGSHVARPVSYSGFHLAPSEIQAGSEHVKVLGFPELTDVPEVETTGYGGIDSFIKQTSFTRDKGAFMKGVNDLSTTFHIDAHGGAARDFQFREPVEGQGLKSMEQAVETGADVCLIGIFDSSRRGIVPDNRPFGRTMKIVPGTADQVMSKLTSASVSVMVFGLIVATICLGTGLLPYAPDPLIARLPAGDKLIAWRNSVRPRQDIAPQKTRPEQKQPIANDSAQKKELSAADREALDKALKADTLIQNGDAEQLRKELEKGLDPNLHIPQQNGYTLPFVEAILYNQMEIARLLLEFGADINAVNAHMFNGLDTAVTYRKAEVVKFLLEAGAEIHPGDARRLSPLNRAILNQDADIVSILLDAGADPTPPGSEQYLASLPADSEKAITIRELLEQAKQRK